MRAGDSSATRAFRRNELRGAGVTQAPTARRNHGRSTTSTVSQTRGGPRDSGVETRMNGPPELSPGSVHSMHSKQQEMAVSVGDSDFTARNRQTMHDSSSCCGAIGD